MISTLLQAEADRLAQKKTVYGQDLLWHQTEYSEILPFPKPLSLSVLRGLAGHDGATGAVCRELGLPYNPKVPIDDYLETVFGRTFVNSVAEQILTRAGTPPSFLKRLLSATRIRQEMLSLYRRFREISGTFAAFFEEHIETDLALLSDRTLLARIAFLVASLNEHYQYVVKSGLFAKFNLDELTARFSAEYLTSLLAADSQLLLHRDPEALHILTFRETSLDAFAAYGASIDYELSCPRFLEQNQSAPQPGAKTGKFAAPPDIPRKARAPLFSFKVYESLKVIFKTMLLKDLYLLRLTLLHYEQRLGREGDLFYLTLAELLSGEGTKGAGRIEQRRRAEAVFERMEIPSTVALADLSTLARGSRKKTQAHPLHGVSVNGMAFAGQAFVCTGAMDFTRADNRRILVVKQASPDLVMTFGKVRGIITETGGMLSHLVIVAREQGFPLVVQVRDATALIRNGDHIKVSKDGTIAINQNRVEA